MPSTTTVSARTLMAACCNLEALMRYRTAVAGAVVLGLPEGGNTLISVSSELAARIEELAHVIIPPGPDPCPYPPMCAHKFAEIASHIGEGGDDFDAVFQGLDALVQPLPRDISFRVSRSV